jgi:LacI family transcriptional regulator
MKKKAINPDETRVTMHAVAKEAGVSIGTVSRVINNRARVRPETARRVEEALRRTGWQPNAVASSMRTGTTRTIGIILPDIRNPLFSAVARSIERTLREHGHTLLFTNSDDEPARDVELMRLLLQRRVDGLIYAPADEVERDTLATVRHAVDDMRVPVVLLERTLSIPTDAVVSDQASGVQRATEYLLSLGHRRVAYLTVGTRSRAGRERRRGFLDAMRLAGIAIDPALQRPECSRMEDAMRETLALAVLDQPPTAIIAGGNMLLPGVLQALNTRGKRVPEDVSVITVGDTDLAMLVPPSFTAVRWDLLALGREAALLMLENIASKNGPRRDPRVVVIPTEIVLRRSCAPPSR